MVTRWRDSVTTPLAPSPLLSTREFASSTQFKGRRSSHKLGFDDEALETLTLIGYSISVLKL